MILDRRIKIQLALFIVIAIVATTIMFFGYIKGPSSFLGIGRYQVTIELPRAGGLYPTGNVTYRGTEVGRIKDVTLSETGVQAVLSLDSDIKIPSDLDAEVHSQSAIGEQYIALLPRNGTSAPLRNGDVIPVDRTSVPPDINALLDATNRGLLAIPQDNLRTVIDEGAIAFGGLGPDLARFVKGGTTLAFDARRNLDPWMSLIDQVQPVLDSQAETSDSIQAWAANLATVTEQLKAQDAALGSFFDNGAAAADEARQLIDQLKPTLPVLLANLAAVGEVALTYQPAIEQLLVLLPINVAGLQTGAVMNRNAPPEHRGQMLDFNLNLNAPPPCTTGYLPSSQVRPPSMVDSPERQPGDIYCRIPQNSPYLVRGARNLPCLTRPGKRAPTVKICESDEEYVPLNDGLNWKGDPNATLSGQDVPQQPPGAPRDPRLAAPPVPVPPIAVATYDPATGSYVGPDGKTYTQSDLARTAPEDNTWQNMLLPPTGN